MLDDFRRVLESIGYRADRSEAQDETGRKIPLLGFKHGVHQLYAFDDKGGVQVVYPMDIAPEDTTLLEKEPDEVVNELFSILKREMLEGRTAYLLVTSEPNNPRNWKSLRQIRLSQKRIVRGTDAYTVQRVADAIQEIVIVAVRCQLVLGEALRSVATGARISQTTYHPDMYR